MIRQALSVAVGAEHRRTSLALDSISVELSFMTGPAIAVVAATTWSTRGVLRGRGLRADLRRRRTVGAEPAGAQRRAPGRARPRRGAAADSSPAWTAGTAGTGFAVTGTIPAADPPHLVHPCTAGRVSPSGAGAALVLSGSEVAVVAQLRHLHHLTFTGVVFVVWGVTSIVGGFVYGALHREISPPVVLLGLAS